MARYPIKIQIDLKEFVEMNYSIRRYRGSFLWELKTKGDQQPFSKSVLKTQGYEMDLIHDALNSILNNARPNLRSENISRLVYRIMEDITLKNISTFALVLQNDGSLEVL